MIDSATLLPQLMQIAEEAGRVILDIYEQGPLAQVNYKQDSSPLTAADMASHRLILSSLERLTPQIPVLSEESSPGEISGRQQWSRYWLIDPLDGTKEFIKRNGEFTVNIALIENHQPSLGVVYAPALKTVYAGCSRTAYAVKQRQGDKPKAIKTRLQTPFRPLALVVSRSHRDPRIDDFTERLRRHLPVSETPMGSSLKLCLIAEGMADLHLRLGPTSEWDTAAAQAVLEAAGGQVLDLEGNPLSYNRGSGLINPDFVALGDPALNWQTGFADAPG